LTLTLTRILDQDPSGKLMMLPSDIVVRDDPKFAKYAKMYAKDGKLWEKVGPSP